MPRPKIDFGEEWQKSLKERIEPFVLQEIGKRPLTENEIFGAALAAIGGKGSHQKLAGDLRRLYSLQFRRRLSERSASLSVVRSLKQAVAGVKEDLLGGGKVFATRKPIQFGKEFYGRIFYLGGQEELVPRKAEAVILRNDCLASKLLRQLKEKDCLFLKDIPYQKRLVDLAVGLLKAYKLARIAEIDGVKMVVREGFEPQTIKLNPVSGKTGMEEGKFFREKGFEVKENFYAGRWALKADGPGIEKFKFSMVAFDRANRLLHLADVARKRADASILRAFKRKADEWGLPASLHFFAPSFTEPAESYAKKWGIALHRGKDI